MVLPLFATCTRRHVAPGAETIRDLFGGEPSLIMIDDVSRSTSARSSEPIPARARSSRPSSRL
jgi:hypothetical protein